MLLTVYLVINGKRKKYDNEFELSAIIFIFERFKFQNIYLKLVIDYSNSLKIYR